MSYSILINTGLLNYNLLSQDNEVIVPNTFIQNVSEPPKDLNEFREDENRNIYEIKTQLYPIPALVKYYHSFGFDYYQIKDKYPELFPYDNSWFDWWKEVNQIARARKIQTQPIKREVTVIYRYKFGEKEKIVWSERFRGTSTKTGQNIWFKHLNGMYQRHYIEVRYDEEKGTDKNVLRGHEKVYFIDYKPEIMDELYQYAPTNKPQKLQIMIMNRPYGNLGLFNRDEYKHNSVEELTRKALNAKGLAPSKETKQFSKSDVSEDKDDLSDALRLITNNPKGLDMLAEALEKRKKENSSNIKEKQK